MPFRLPNRSHRLSIVGHTGSGKTQFAAWVLSHSNIDRMPWVVVDYKYDRLLNSIRQIREISVVGRPPRKAGLYIVHPVPHQEDEVDDFLWRIWERGKTGVYIDEAHMLPSKRALPALLTQGRSKSIPMITITQKPSWTSRFVFSEADFFSIFWLNDRQDRKRIEELTGGDADAQPLPEYHSRYHDVAKNTNFVLKPVPTADSILERFEHKLRPRGWFA